MKILILNGSPKGEISVTMQYMKYIEKKFTKDEFIYENIAFDIKKYLKDSSLLDALMLKVEECDGVIWAFPLYYMTVCSQYQRFIELIFENNYKEYFKNKFAASFSTSIHFYDHTAHNYIQGICDDLDMKYTGDYSSKMDTMMKEANRISLERFFDNFKWCIKNNNYMEKRYQPVNRPVNTIGNYEIENKLDISNKKVLIISDSKKNDNLSKMVDMASKYLDGKLQMQNLHDLDIKGGCLGCLKCSFDYNCSYTGKDEYIEFYKEKVMKADIIIFAMNMANRLYSCKWKEYFDRSFFMTHTPSIINKQIGIFVSGPVSKTENIEEILRSYIELNNSNYIGLISDEANDTDKISQNIYRMLHKVVYSSRASYIKHETFRGIAGKKIFRDDMIGGLKGIFQADHKYYKKHGFYDFPQKNYRGRFFAFIIRIISLVPVIRANFHKGIKEQMIANYKKYL
jgi:multimeric flavodoxin WrbA